MAIARRNRQRPMPDEPPLYTIDLSLLPNERYKALAKDFKAELQGMTGLFEDLVHDVHPRLPVAPFVGLARLFLRRLYTEEETDEVRGIAKVTGVPMYLLVAFNLLLDSFMGCSSGGIRVHEKHNPMRTRMLHYRTLDWSMDPLRHVVVRLQYIQGPDSPVIARAVTYVGYVGVLTAVKRGLSLSLNFRAEHDNSTRRKDIQYYWHLLLVMLGLRPSISSVLRACVFNSTGKEQHLLRFAQSPDSLDSLANSIMKTRTCAAFLILCDGQESIVLEKDLDTALCLRSKSFIAATNSDQRHDPSDWAEFFKTNDNLFQSNRGLQGRQQLASLIEESADRKQCMKEKWETACKRYKRGHPGAGDEDVSLEEEEVQRWVRDFPITNESTHYACVMDPTSGEILWCDRHWGVAPLPEHVIAKDD